jgi:hypothetical protein
MTDALACRAGGEADGAEAGSRTSTVRAHLLRCGEIRPEPRRAAGRSSRALGGQFATGLRAKPP